MVGMPRKHLTVEKAKKETRFRLISTLAANPQGLRFTKWLDIADVHRDTLATWIPKLLKEKVVEKDGRIYMLTKYGTKALQKSFLLRIIEESKGYCALGGKGGALESTVGYAFPPTSPSFLDIKDFVHRSFIAHWLYRQADRLEIDPRYLTGEFPKNELLNLLREKLPKGTQVLAFSWDFDKIRELINEDYVSDVLGFLKESKYMAKIGKLALEKKALVMLEDRRPSHKGELTEIAEHLGISSNEAEQLLDGLVIDKAFDVRPTKEQIMFNNFLQDKKIPHMSAPQEIRVKHENGRELTVRVVKSKRYLKKTVSKEAEGERVYYELATKKS